MKLVRVPAVSENKFGLRMRLLGNFFGFCSICYILYTFYPFGDEGILFPVKVLVVFSLSSTIFMLYLALRRVRGYEHVQSSERMPKIGEKIIILKSVPITNKIVLAHNYRVIDINSHEKHHTFIVYTNKEGSFLSTCLLEDKHEFEQNKTYARMHDDGTFILTD